MISSHLKSLSAAAALLVAITVVAVAQSAPGPAADAGPRRGEAMAACRTDMQSLCAGIAAGGGAKLQCLVENRAKASPECQAVMATLQQRGDRKAAKAERKARAQACATDVATFCVGAKGAARSECLKANETKLSPECTSARQQAKDQRRVITKQVQEACKADADTVCGAAAKGRGARMQCLRENQAKLSPTCGQALASLPVRKRDRQATGTPSEPKPQ